MSDHQTRLELGDYFADVLEATSGTEPFWYYIIQRKGSNVIIDLVRFDTIEEAAVAAQKALAAFSQAAAASAD